MVYLMEYDSLLCQKVLRFFNQLIINPTDSNTSDRAVSVFWVNADALHVLLIHKPNPSLNLLKACYES